MGGKITLTGKYAQKAEEILKKLTSLFNKAKIPYILEGGTLLGVIRENRLLPWDNDLDLTITEENAEKLFAEESLFKRAGFLIRKRYFEADHHPFKKGDLRIIKIKKRECFFFKSKVMVDLFVKRKVADKYYWTVSKNNPILKSAPAHFYEELTDYQYKDFKVSIPEDYQGYLTFRYGDWQTVVKDYNFKTDDKAIISS